MVVVDGGCDGGGAVRFPARGCVGEGGGGEAEGEGEALIFCCLVGEGVGAGEKRCIGLIVGMGGGLMVV